MTTPSGLRQTQRVLLVTMSAVGLLLASSGPSMATTLTAVPASIIAAPPAGLTVVSAGSGTANLAWQPVPGAAEYRLAYSLTPDMLNTTWRDSAVTSRTIYELKEKSTYYVKVRALDATGKGLTGYSSAIQVKTTAAAPAAPADLKSTRTTPTTLGLSWGAVPGAVEYRVELTRTGGLPAYTRHSGTVADLRGLTPASGYSARVRALDAVGNALTAYSPAIQAQTPAVPVLAPVVNPLKVASFNIHCANCMDPVPGERTWVERRDTVIADVITRMPDIVGFQEASQGWLATDTRRGGVSQFEDLKERLAAAGGKYEVTDPDRNNCEDSTRPTNCVYKDQGASQGTKIFYNPDKVTVLRTGSQILPAIDPASNGRYVAWAEVVQKSSGKKFFFADTHLQTGTGVEYTDLRGKQAAVVAQTIARENTGALPVILVGDMNSSKWKTPSNSAYDVFVSAGLIDPLGNTYQNRYASGDATAETVINRGSNSFNAYSMLNFAGDPGTSGSYIDYIFTSKNTRVQLYENVTKIDASGNRVGLPGSDHNMQFGIIGLP